MSVALFILFYAQKLVLFLPKICYIYTYSLLFILFSTPGAIMPKTTLPHWDYLDRTIHARWDFTQLDRLPTDTDCPSLNALNARINERNETIEDMFIQIECDRIDREEAQADKPKPKRKSRKPSKKDLFEDIDEATRQELLNEGFELE